jgi:hypothetical protein
MPGAQFGARTMPCNMPGAAAWDGHPCYLSLSGTDAPTPAYSHTHQCGSNRKLWITLPSTCPGECHDKPTCDGTSQQHGMSAFLEYPPPGP